VTRAKTHIPWICGLDFTRDSRRLTRIRRMITFSFKKAARDGGGRQIERWVESCE